MPSTLKGYVTLEAMKIARKLVKDEMKRQNIRISSVTAKDITLAANTLLATPIDGPAIALVKAAIR